MRGDAVDVAAVVAVVAADSPEWGCRVACLRAGDVVADATVDKGDSADDHDNGVRRPLASVGCTAPKVCECGRNVRSDSAVTGGKGDGCCLSCNRSQGTPIL